MARYTISPNAQRDLVDLWKYLAIEVSVARADIFLDTLVEKFAALAEHPTLGRLRDELMPELRSLAVARYIIFYFPIEDGINVVRVLHGARDLDAIFQEDEEGGDTFR